MTVEQLIVEAKANNWNRRQIKDACYAAGIDAAGRQQAWDACGIEKQEPAAPKQQPSPVFAAVATVVAPVAAQPVAEPIKLEDGCTIFCDSAANTATRVVNSYGRQKKYDNGGFRVAVKSGKLVERFTNTVCPDSFAGECFAVLKAIEVAVQHGLNSVVISNDRIGGFKATTKPGYKGTMYLGVAEKIARENNLAVTFEVCTSEDNKADYASKTEK